MIIEIEVEAKNEREWNIFQSIFAFSCNHLKSSWGRPSQPEKEDRACRGEWDVVEILKIKLLRKRLMHIMLVALATMAVTSVMVVMLKIAMTYLLTCQFTGTWPMQLQELPQTPLVLLLLRISVFTTSICIFSAISFGFMGILLTLNDMPLCECCTECLTTQKFGFLSNFICISQILGFSSQRYCVVKPQ